jgi:hypothetical protein
MTENNATPANGANPAVAFENLQAYRPASGDVRRTPGSEGLACPATRALSGVRRIQSARCRFHFPFIARQSLASIAKITSSTHSPLNQRLLTKWASFRIPTRSINFTD